MANAQKLKVLIVDDFDMTRSLLRIILRGENFNVVGEACNGREGVELCAQLKPDIVCLDVIMPIMNGLEALTRMSAMSPSPMIIMVTGNDDIDLVEEAMKKGASGYIIKPFNSSSVVDTINEARKKFVVKHAAAIKETKQIV